MSYYKPSYSQSISMVRGRGYSSRSSYRGNSARGSSSWGGSRGRGDGGYSSSRYSSSFSGMESRSPYDMKSKYSSSSGDRFSRSDDYHKSYRSDSGYMGRESRRSPDRKRMRLDAPSSRHESSYGGYGARGRHDTPSYSDRRYSGERHTSTPFSTRRDEFRRPSGPPRGTYRGRLSTRGTRGLRGRDRPMRRRLLESSYAVRKRIVPRTVDYNRRLKISRLRSAIVARRATRRRDSEKESDDDAEKDTEKTEGEDAEKEIDDKDGEKSPIKDKEAGDKDGKSESGDEKKKKKTFIKLHCPQCSVRAITFRKYEIHLQSKTHLFAMRKVALKQKGILAQMRQAQRNTQNELEKSSDELSTKTNFCPLCKLNYKQKKAVHQLSEAHKNMKKFLMPFCKVCNITFKSPMIYENHLCSIDHMKRKQRMENSSDVSAEEDNLENFTTIDSIGDVDGDGDGAGSEHEEKKEEVKEPVNVGIEQIRKIEAHYCDLCKMYLQRGEESEMSAILAKHCKLRIHMQRYVRMKERQDLEKRAEKLQRKETAEKEDKDKKDPKENESVDEGEEKEKKSSDSSAKGNDDEETKDDKLWADVDKDLGDILAEAESGNKSSDEDDDSHINGERYDRFKLSEKNGDEKLMGADEESILDDKLIIKESEEK